MPANIIRMQQTSTPKYDIRNFQESEEAPLNKINELYKGIASVVGTAPDEDDGVGDSTGTGTDNAAGGSSTDELNWDKTDYVTQGDVVSETGDDELDHKNRKEMFESIARGRDKKFGGAPVASDDDMLSWADAGADLGVSAGLADTAQGEDLAQYRRDSEDEFSKATSAKEGLHAEQDFGGEGGFGRGYVPKQDSTRGVQDEWQRGKLRDKRGNTRGISWGDDLNKFDGGR